MNVLVTGGAGYLGSHTCVALIEAGHSVTIADNLCNSSADVLAHIRQITGCIPGFYPIDVTDTMSVNKLFEAIRFDGVIHFAGYKAVGESIEKPLEYYYNNLVSTLVLASACRKYDVTRFVFSSSATVYGKNKIPFVETMELLPAENPYGETKVICEKILSEVAKTNPSWSVAMLRYFNPVGAHISGKLGEKPKGLPNNLMPCITQVANGECDRLRVFGNDYPTADGTGVRDYIHVMDLAEGHVAAISNLAKGLHIYNFGMGRGTSVLQLVKTFEETNGVEIPYEVVERRPGDIAECFADVLKVERELGWRAKRGLAEMCRDSWRANRNKIE